VSSVGSCEAETPKSFTKSSKLKAGAKSIGCGSGDGDDDETFSSDWGGTSVLIVAKSCSTVGFNMNVSGSSPRPPSGPSKAVDPHIQGGYVPVPTSILSGRGAMRTIICETLRLETTIGVLEVGVLVASILYQKPDYERDQHIRKIMRRGDNVPAVVSDLDERPAHASKGVRHLESEQAMEWEDPMVKTANPWEAGLWRGEYEAKWGRR
jgi:hypothetical protein